MSRCIPARLALTALVTILGAMPAQAAIAARNVPARKPALPARKPAAPAPAVTSQPAVQSVIPVDTLRNVFLGLHKAAEQAERMNTAAGTLSALEKYRKMQQMIQRFPEMRVEASYKDLVTRKIADLQPKVADNARQAAARERAARAARAAQARTGYAAGVAFGLVGPSGGGGSFGGGAAACPPGAARSGHT